MILPVISTYFWNDFMLSIPHNNCPVCRRNWVSRNSSRPLPLHRNWSIPQCCERTSILSGLNSRRLCTTALPPCPKRLTHSWRHNARICIHISAWGSPFYSSRLISITIDSLKVVAAILSSATGIIHRQFRSLFSWRRFKLPLTVASRER